MLIGINGFAGDGKDTLFARIRHLFDTGVLQLPARPERRAFADKLKQSVAALFGISIEYLEKAKRDETTLVQIRELRFGVSRIRGLRWTRHLPGFERIVVSQTMRVTLQRKGTEAGREVFGDSFWVDQCVPPSLDHYDDVIAVTDVRFPNEAKRIRANNGIVVRVSAGGVSGDPHPSEQVLDASLIDVEVDNSVRGDGFANLDAEAQRVVKAAQAVDPSQPEKRQVVRPVRTVSSEVRPEDLKIRSPRDIHRGQDG